MDEQPAQPLASDATEKKVHEFFRTLVLICSVSSQCQDEAVKKRRGRPKDSTACLSECPACLARICRG